MRGYYTVYLKDYAAAFSREEYERSRQTIYAHYGVVVDSAEAVKCCKLK